MAKPFRSYGLVRWLWRNYQRNARNAKPPHAWGISERNFDRLIKEPCTYCGSPPGQKIRYYNHKTEKYLSYTGIDRKNNARGYVNGNCVPCCGVCNSIKGKHLTHQEMLAVMKVVRVLRDAKK